MITRGAQPGSGYVPLREWAGSGESLHGEGGEEGRQVQNRIPTSRRKIRLGREMTALAAALALSALPGCAEREAPPPATRPAGGQASPTAAQASPVAIPPPAAPKPPAPEEGTTLEAKTQAPNTQPPSPPGGIVVRRLTPQELDELGVKDWPIWTHGVGPLPWTYEQKETCYILEGEVVVEAGGGEVLIKPGDFVVFPEGLTCIWKIQKAVKKHYRFD
jgi:hypothetical protein